MADSVAVFPPGFRVTDDSTGEPVPGAIISFFDAGTTAPKTVFSDDILETEIGTEITCDALGYPTSDGSSTRTLIYVGTELYKVKATDADGVTLWEHDNVKGAVVSAESSNVSVTATFPVVSKSLDYAVLAADQNTTFKVNPSSGDVTLTLPSAVTVGTGWKVKVQHAGTANQVLIKVATGSGQLIAEGSKSHGGTFSLARNGEDCEISSDGGNWLVSSHTHPFLKLGVGILPVVSRVSSAPVSPAEASLYLATSSGTWSSVSVSSGDIVFWSGAVFVPFTPYTDCGWTAYVADENRNYQFVDSAWVTATQALMEAVTSGLPVTAEMQHFHPGHPKAWVYSLVDGSGVPTLTASYNITSLTDTGVGRATVNIGTDFSSSNWAPIPGSSNSNASITNFASSVSGSVELDTRNVSNTLTDPLSYSFAGFGDQ